MSSSSKNEGEERPGKRIVAGSTVNKTTYDGDDIPIENLPKNSWSPCDSTSFHLRIGPDYHVNKAKSPSLEAYYEIVGVDFVKTSKRINNVGSQVTIPAEWLEFEKNEHGLPPVFILNVQIPSDFSFSFFADVSDGEGWSLVLYFKLTASTIDMFKDPRYVPPALLLLQKYCQEAPESFGLFGCSTKNYWAGRMKMIGRVEHIEDYNLPNFISTYNAKPVLIRSTGTLIKGENYLEMDINMYVWGNVARQALQILFYRFSNMVNAVGFCIESLCDEEMPENLFGCGRILKLDPENCVNWDEL